MAEMKCDTFRLTYCGIFGKALKVSHQGREIFLPVSQISFRRPTDADFMKPINVVIPLWLARKAGIM